MCDHCRYDPETSLVPYLPFIDDTGCGVHVDKEHVDRMLEELPPQYLIQFASVIAKVAEDTLTAAFAMLADSKDMNQEFDIDILPLGPEADA